ncbi:DUF4304 domain-containing protein [Chitinophaga cymbidii]|uniref:DUF4304 domain-containing protein n=1 Tax=Chitinophaga cymbidii TaxID=1096750 RepID=A0A512RPB1_9BACT|nr:DUF4304 domain-containing protein [Chitinophaga cymbidii]GEP97521.1 hypothetical protein CCY01nite_37810 [Chitinophaga cymbidii]
MEKKELASILSEILVPIGFKKKGNYWVVNGTEITKMVNLQKSQFSNCFYINYGYILNTIPLNGLTMHVFGGLGSLDSNENARIKELLNLENSISDEERASGLKKVLIEKLAHKVSSVNTEADVLVELKKQPHLNNIPLVVKRHFHLPE